MSVYWRMVRPGLLLMVLFSMAAAALTAERPPDWPELAHALLGTALLISGATAANQLIERRRDAEMARTAPRPLPSGRLSTRAAALFAAACSLAGIGYLAATVSPAVPLLGAVNWGLYVLIYTPLKRRTVWHLAVGAAAGAMPALLGAATAQALAAPASWALFGMVFFWQFPHTAAIGWICREQYARAGIMVAAAADPSGRLAGRMAFFGAAGLLSASLVPAVLSTAGRPYAAVALSSGLVHAVLAARFLRRPDDSNARALWRMSLVHLPLLLLALLYSARVSGN